MIIKMFNFKHELSNLLRVSRSKCYIVSSSLQATENVSNVYYFNDHSDRSSLKFQNDLNY